MSVLVISCWCLSGVSVVSLGLNCVFIVSWLSPGGISVVSWLCLGGVLIVSRLCLSCLLVVLYLGGDRLFPGGFLRFCRVSVVSWWSCRAAAAETAAKIGSNKKPETALLGLIRVNGASAAEKSRLACAAGAGVTA